MADLPDDSYPEHWKPAHVRQEEHVQAQRAVNAETYLGELDDDDLDELIARIRPTTGGPR